MAKDLQVHLEDIGSGMRHPLRPEVQFEEWPGGPSEDDALSTAASMGLSSHPTQNPRQLGLGFWHAGDADTLEQLAIELRLPATTCAPGMLSSPCK